MSTRKLVFPTYFIPLLAVVCLTGCAKKYHNVDQAKYQEYRMDTEMTEEDPELLAMIQPYKEELESKMHEVLILSEIDLTKQRPESTLGNFLADLMVERSNKYLSTEVDFGVLNYGGIRKNKLPAGPITLANVYEVMPFDNFLVVVDVKGSTVRTFCDHMAKADGWPVSKELQYEIVDGKARDIRIQGAPLDDDKIYKVALSDYIANGGDYCEFLEACGSISTGVYLRDAIAEYLRNLNEKGGKINSVLDQRVKKTN